MIQIRCVYVGKAPNFPATDQHPNAVRYVVDNYVVDSIGGQPTKKEITDFLAKQSLPPGAV